MPRNDEGQFEVLLGNKQLLSILFIVVILLGVFFTMGYTLGRNAASPDTAVASSQVKRAGSAAADSKNTSPFAGESQPPVSQESAPPVSPAASGERAEPPAAAPVTQPANLGAPAVPPAATPSARTAEPVAGQTYLQVAAVKRPEAEVIHDVLRKKGFNCLIAPHPTEPVYRVLVGPLRNVDEISKTRADLQTVGFKTILRKF